MIPYAKLMLVAVISKSLTILLQEIARILLYIFAPLTSTLTSTIRVSLYKQADGHDYVLIFIFQKKVTCI